MIIEWQMKMRNYNRYSIPGSWYFIYVNIDSDISIYLDQF